MALEKASEDFARTTYHQALDLMQTQLNQLQQRIEVGEVDEGKDGDDEAMRELGDCMQKLNALVEKRQQLNVESEEVGVEKEDTSVKEEDTGVESAEKSEGEASEAKEHTKVEADSTDIKKDPGRDSHFRHEQDEAQPQTPQHPSPTSHTKPKRWRLPNTPTTLPPSSSKPGTKSNQKANALLNAPPSPTTHSTSTHPLTLARERLIFTSHKRYRQIRALFPLASEPDHPYSLRWDDLRNLLGAAPMNCLVIPANGGAGFAIVRPARNGVLRRQVVIHKPHGRNPEVERHVLENMDSELAKHIGWRRSDFVFEG